MVPTLTSIVPVNECRTILDNSCNEQRLKIARTSHLGNGFAANDKMSVPKCDKFRGFVYL